MEIKRFTYDKILTLVAYDSEAKETEVYFNSFKIKGYDYYNIEVKGYSGTVVSVPSSLFLKHEDKVIHYDFELEEGFQITEVDNFSDKLTVFFGDNTTISLRLPKQELAKLRSYIRYVKSIDKKFTKEKGCIYYIKKIYWLPIKLFNRLA